MRMPRVYHMLATAGIVAVLALATALPLRAIRPKTATAQQPVFSFVGQVTAADTYIGIVTNGTAVFAYVTNGRDQADWFRASMILLSGAVLDLPS
jgi:hypothetical protein